MLTLLIGTALLASSPVRTYDAVVHAVFREDTFGCLPDAAANAFRLQLQAFRIDGVPKPLVPRTLVSAERFASLSACWREALAVTDRNLGRDIDERLPVEIDHESFEIETPRHPIFMDR